MSDDPPDWPNPGVFITQVGLTDGWDSTAVKHRDDIGVSTVGGGDVGGGPGRDGDVRPPPRKQYIPIYSDSYDIGAVSRGGAVNGSAGNQ